MNSEELKANIEAMRKKYGDTAVLSGLVEYGALEHAINDLNEVLKNIDAKEAIKAYTPKEANAGFFGWFNGSKYRLEYIHHTFGEKALKKFIDTYYYYMDSYEGFVKLNALYDVREKIIKIEIIEFLPPNGTQKRIEEIEIKGD